MSKNLKLNELFIDWERSIPEYQNKFISDGIIDENEFCNAKKKILFIAKEPNNPLQKDKWDFRNILKD